MSATGGHRAVVSRGPLLPPGSHVEALVQTSFRTVAQLLSNNESFRSLVGVVTRLTNLLLVLEEVAAEREAQGQGAQQLSDIPLRGDA